MSARALVSAQKQSSSRVTPCISAVLQRMCACGTHTIRGDCEDCKSKKGFLQRASLSSGGRGTSGEGGVPPIVHEVLCSPGQPLDATTRAFMEPRFGHDFSQVRVHTDANAAKSARAVNALAYTVGRDVVFGTGQPALGSFAGKRLLAHELTHVVQQQDAASVAGQLLRIDAADRPAEREADAYSSLVVEGPRMPRPSSSVRTRDVALQRQLIGGNPGSVDDEGKLLWESFRQSTTLDDFDLDQATLKPQHLAKLEEFKERFQTLLGRYPDSFISVIGYTDATGTEQHNKTLGQDRADTVKTELTSGDSALPAEIVHASSLGESMLAVETKLPEARNRRVDIIPQLRQFFKLPVPPPSQRLPNVSGPGGSQPQKPSVTPGPSPLPHSGTPKIPDVKIPQRNWLEDALRNHPIIKSLPVWARDKVIDASKDGDEVLAEKVIDPLPLDDKTKAVVQAVVKSLLQIAKGKKFEVPTPPLYEMPPSAAPTVPKAPGEVIPGTTFRF